MVSGFSTLILAALLHLATGRSSLDDDRPKIVDKKAIIGDWELDTIAGTASSGAFVSMLDRSYQYTLGKSAVRWNNTFFYRCWGHHQRLWA